MPLILVSQSLSLYNFLCSILRRPCEWHRGESQAMRFLVYFKRRTCWHLLCCCYSSLPVFENVERYACSEIPPDDQVTSRKTLTSPTTSPTTKATISTTKAIRPATNTKRASVVPKIDDNNPLFRGIHEKLSVIEDHPEEDEEILLYFRPRRTSTEERRRNRQQRQLLAEIWIIGNGKHIRKKGSGGSSSVLDFLFDNTRTSRKHMCRVEIMCPERLAYGVDCSIFLTKRRLYFS